MKFITSGVSMWFRMDDRCVSDDDQETDEQREEQEGWLPDTIPDGAGCVEIWDRLQDVRDEE